MSMKKIATALVAGLVAWCIVLFLVAIKYPGVFFGVLATFLILAAAYGYYSRVVN
jgi:hypothetical protein